MSLLLSLLAKVDELLEQNKALLARTAELESGQKANVPKSVALMIGKRLYSSFCSSRISPALRSDTAQ